MRLCREGWPFIIGCLTAAVVLLLIASLAHTPSVGLVSGVAFLATLFCLNFFRDPIRVTPPNSDWIISPADGKVTEIVEVSDPAWTEPVWVIRIFLSVFDVHLQRTPVPGTIRTIQYKTGKFFDARDPRAAFENEQNRIEIDPTNKALRGPIVVTQIAGLIARRIVCDVKVGQSISLGQRLGMIRFGSQVNLVVPKIVTICIKAGDRVKTGETIVAKLGAGVK